MASISLRRRFLMANITSVVALLSIVAWGLFFVSPPPQASPNVSDIGTSQLHAPSGALAAKQPVSTNVESTVPNRIRILVKHGLDERALDLLHDDNLESLTAQWSRGRIYWYISLCHRLTGNHGAARGWARRAQNRGIPELGEDADEFWLQFESWDRVPAINTVRDRIAAYRSGPPVVFASQKKSDPGANTRGIVDEIRKTKKNDADILDQVRLATWELLLGEYTAAHESLYLPTTSINSLLTGKKHLKELEARIEASPELEDKISTDPRLAIRLDTARVRMVVFKQKEELSRDRENARLEQLRQIVNSYQDLHETIVRWQIYQTLEDREKTSAAAQKALASLNDVFKVVRDRRDFHLFDNEPAVEGKGEFKIVQTEHLPFSKEPLSMLKSLQGLAYYNLVRDADKPDAELTRQAKAWAEAALADEDKKDLDVPDGADPNNLVANLVLGLVEDAEGHRLAFDPDGDNRTKAAAHFAKAKEYLESFIALLREKNYADSTELSQQAEKKLSHLVATDTHTQTAHEHADKNHFDQAHADLVAATKRHRDPATAITAIEIGLRQGFPVGKPENAVGGQLIPVDELEKEWKHYVELGIIDPATPEGQLILAKIRNRRAGEALARDERRRRADKALVPDDRNAWIAAKAGVDEARIQLDALAKKKTLKKELSMEIASNSALAFAYGWALDRLIQGEETPAREADIEAAYNRAQNSIVFFDNRLKERAANRGGGTPQDRVESQRMREALVASRIAAGHLAFMHLAKHRDESKLEFHAAADEAARLKNTHPVLPLIGSPLLEQVFNQSEGGQIKLANEERQRRQMVTRCLEAMFTADFDSAEAGAEQMQEAVRIGTGNQAGQPGTVDAAELAAAADGFDAKVSLPDTIRAFSVLSDIKAADSIDAEGSTDLEDKKTTWYSRALTKAVALASKNEIQVEQAGTVSDDQLSVSRKTIQSPLVAFTFAKAIESYAVNIQPEEKLDRREMLISQSIEAYERGTALLEAERINERFPHMMAVIQKSIQAMREPELFLDKSLQFARERRFSEAISEASKGVARHPRNQPLWRAYFEASIEQVKFGEGGSDQRLQKLMARLVTMNEKGLLSDFEAAYHTATILEFLKELEEARQKYLQATDVAESDTDRIRSQANAGRLLAELASNQLAAEKGQQ